MTRQPPPPEAPPDWRDWGPDARHDFIERLGMGADRITAIEQARRTHEQERRAGMLFPD